MSDKPEPNDESGVPESSPVGNGPAISFGQAARRGIAVAHQTLHGALIILAIIGPLQVAAAVSGGLLMEGQILQPPAEGEPPPPELFMLMGAGCFNCIWLLVLIFGMPWATGGIYGQIADRVAGRPAQPFAELGKRYYARLLGLLLIYFALLIVLMIPAWVVTAMVSASQMSANNVDPERWREMGQHPVNIAAGVFYGVLLTVMGTVMTLVQAALVTDNLRLFEGISAAFRFIGRNLGAAGKLFLVFLLVSVPMAVVQQLPNLVPGVGLTVMLVSGVLLSLYLSYIAVFNAGIGVSVYGARRSA